MTAPELRAIRNRLGLSQEAFAPLVGAPSGRYVRRWECENPKAANAHKVPLGVALMAQALLERPKR